MLRVFLPPLITVYAIFVAMVVVAVRRPVRRPGRIGDRSAPRYPGRLIGTIVGGYATFLAIVLVFHVWIADQPEAFPSALWGGAFLCGVTLALAAVSSLLTRHRARR
jgi:drug/metabolite transporter (DMT)-like permease